MSGRDPAPDGPDPWAALARLTAARVALGRSGASLPTREVLRFGLAHAQARDAVHAAFELDTVAAGLAALGLDTVAVASAAPSRDVYLRRPDLGRRLADDCRDRLAPTAGPPDVVLVVGDGLSATAIHRNAAGLCAALLPLLVGRGLTVGPAVLARQARVALADEIGERLRARATVMLIGERPGLSAPDSLGAYLTMAPRPGRTDAERNCVSNIRAGGLPWAEAAFKLAWLLGEALRRGVSGVALKDESEGLIEAQPATRRLDDKGEGAGSG